jgi:transposase InsO family protein
LILVSRLPRSKSGCKKILDSKKWESQEELRIAIVHWIEGTHHRRRRKRSLGKMAPVEYEATHEVIDKELLIA